MGCFEGISIGKGRINFSILTELFNDMPGKHENQ